MTTKLYYLDADERNLVPDWMAKALAYNPGYNGWGIGDDYMKPMGGGWDSAFKLTELKFGWDELNLLANFHFSVHFDREDCADCGRTGESLYSRRINVPIRASHLSDEDRALLVENNRPLNIVDAISAGIIKRDRCKKMGVARLCAKCNGNGYINNDVPPKLNLTMWVLHPRKGASRGVLFENIAEADLPKAVAMLREGRANNETCVWANLDA